ncbi:bifunctional diguanylate cyclase/phosphodiesterase [Devosia sp.]|uniref:putative bifunctional diguanylate cyclase/phosphodiesterase n=1 Tax=Devosia sp. TaxID=1871048 RepID=UPI001AC6EF99|nr:bifunctional diguanylate cyclase/phosphodiesterase [Devosia sp.]MBN9334120.1 bifunctional diguanylate cyclase/phosphodiesterase [Devosia sp.]
MTLSSPADDRSVSAQIVWTAVVLAGCMAAAAILSAWWAVGRIDERALSEQIQTIESALFDTRSRLTADQAALSIAGDDPSTPFNDELDRRLTITIGHDRAYILGSDGRVLRASVNGRYAGRVFHLSDAAVLNPIIERLRLQIAQAAFHDPGLRATNAMGISALETVGFADGSQGFVSVRPIGPPQRSGPESPGGDYLLVSIKQIDQSMVQAIGKQFSIANLRRVPHPTTAAWLALRDEQGKILTYLTWTPVKPAQALVGEATPALVAMLLMVGGAMATLLAWLRRTSLTMEASRAHATYLSLHDPLTGTANRALFEQRLREARNFEFLAETKVLLISVDIDHFKQINDSWGHAAGDQLLKEVSKRLAIEMPEEATVARLGGDEFAVIHPGILSDGQARWICQRLVQCTKAPIIIGTERIDITLSLGAALENGHEIEPEELLRRADVALYAAKIAGRDGFTLYTPEMDREKRERRALELELRNALITGTGLRLVYQPIYAANGGDIAGAEALVRWAHPTRGMLPPDAFIALAEECGIIDQLGEWVLREACRFALDAGLPRVAVNVSPVQLQNDRLAERVLGILAETGLPAERLEIEITEGVLLQNSPQMQDTIRTLRHAGAGIALDDFGTGYASISYLRSYAVDKLKVDRSYVQLVSTDRAMNHIVRLIVETGRALGMAVTAEGIETQDQRRLLTEMGCTYLQGYLFARPLAPEDMRAMLEPARRSEADLRQKFG